MASEHEYGLVILLIGPSASGKSSFVKSILASEKEAKEIAIYSLSDGVKPATPESKAYTVDVKMPDGLLKRFTLIDTPGFVDSASDNLIILDNIVKAVLDVGSKKVVGAIYFHDITQGRLLGTTNNVLSLFKLICGKSFYPRVTCITTMWHIIKPESHPKYEQLNTELEKGPLKFDGAPKIFKRKRDDNQCAIDVLKHFDRLNASKTPPPTLQIVKEVESTGTRRVKVGKTSAGREIFKKTAAVETGSGGCCTIM